MRTLITGGNGFIGRNIEGDFYLTRDNLDQVNKFSPELVIDLAWEGVVHRSRLDAHIQERNIKYKEQLYEAVKHSVQRWVGCGSQAEINLPNLPYSYCKTAVRTYLESKIKNLAWIRIYSVYGPGDNELNYIPYLIRELKQGKDPELTDQNIQWDYLYVSDAAEAIKIISNSQEIGIFELGSGKTVWTQVVATMLRNKISPYAVLQFGKKPCRAVELNYLCADISRLKGLGWSPKVDINEGLNKTILGQ